MIFKKINLSKMKKLFLAFLILTLSQNTSADNTNMNSQSPNSNDTKSQWAVTQNINSDSDNNFLFTQSDEPSDLDLLMTLGGDENDFNRNDRNTSPNHSDDFNENKNTNNEKSFDESKQNNTNGIDEQSTSMTSSKIDDEVKSNDNDNMTSDNLSNTKNESTNNSFSQQNLDMKNDLLGKELSEELQMPKLEMNGVEQKTNNENQINTDKINENKSDEIKNLMNDKESLNNADNPNNSNNSKDHDNIMNNSNEKEKKDEKLDEKLKDINLSSEDKSSENKSTNADTKTDASLIAENLDDMKKDIENLNNMKIDAPVITKEIEVPKITQEVEKKDKKKPQSMIDKIKNLFEKEDKKNEESKEAKFGITNIKPPQVIDNTNRVVKADIKKTPMKVEKIHRCRKVKKAVRKDDAFDEITKNIDPCENPKVFDLTEFERTQKLQEEYMGISEGDSQYEDKIYEYNRKQINITKKYKLNDYKIKVNVPEFLKSHENTIGNGHLNDIYYRKDYINALFAAVSDEDLSAIDSLLRVIKNIDMKNSQGETLLTYAAKNRKITSFKYLLMRGCDINMPNKKGETVEIILKKNGNKQMLVLLKQS